MTVTCPYCFEPIEVTLFAEEGEKQEFITDCEVCCHPLEVKATWDDSTEDFYVEIERAD